METALKQQLLACKKCRRLHNQLKRLQVSHPDYWNQPVPPSGPETASILVVGLAPGMHGANKTGVPFIGDASGDMLHKVLDACGLTKKVRITNVVKCLPVKNLPNGREVNNCSRYLEAELHVHANQDHAIALALGGVAHRAVIRTLGLRQKDFEFAHGAVHDLPGFTMVDSYHCSRYNTQTGRLTEAMFMEVMEKAVYLSHG